MANSKMKKNILIFLLCSMLPFGSFTGCGHDESGTEALSKSETKYSDEKNSENTEFNSEISTKTTDESIKEINSDIMQPPENGWTIEELLSVSTFCDKQLSYPITMDMLGDDFSLNTDEYSDEKDGNLLTTLYYKNEFLCPLALSVSNVEDIKGDTSIAFISMDKNDVFENYIKINSITFGSSYDEVENALGTPTNDADKSDKYGMWDYELNNNGESCLRVTFTDGKVNSLILKCS